MSHRSVPQSERQIPLVRNCDVLVVGGTVAGVAAAKQASLKDTDVILVTDRPYVGEDLCTTLRLWQSNDAPPLGPLGQKLFSGHRTTTPMRVKTILEKELQEQNIEVFLCTYVTDLLEDEHGNIAGAVMTNRAGRQAIAAKQVIDATTYAWIARMGGAKFSDDVRKTERFASRIILGRDAPKDMTDVRKTGFTVTRQKTTYAYHEYRFPVTNERLDFLTLTNLNSTARDACYLPGQVRAAERLWLPPVHAATTVKSADKSALFSGALRPRDCQGILLAGPCAAIRDVTPEQLMEAGWAERLGKLAGKTAADDAVQRPATKKMQVRIKLPSGPAGVRDISECLTGLRKIAETRATVISPAMELPVLATCDVVVAGGGTSGACAAISAGRDGQKVLVLEYQEALGGIGTMGLIGKPYHGRNVGFGAEVPFPDKEQGIEHKTHWFRSEIRKTGGQIWYGVLACGAVLEGNRAAGVVVATPEGRGIVLADVVIDATGNADVAAAAGAETRFGNIEEDLALQGTGLPTRPLGKFYVNTDYLLVDETDIVDITRTYLGAHQTMSTNLYDCGPMIQSRERHRIVGDHTLRYLDQITERTYPDSILYSASDYDSHGYPSNPYFALIPHDETSLKANHPAPGGSCWTPYRCLLPKGLEGILVIGLGISMERDASAMVRMQHDMHNLGYAAGAAAAMAVDEGKTPRGIDVKCLQRHLVDIGNLPADVLDHEDNFPFSSDVLETAVKDLPLGITGSRKTSAKALAIVLLHRERTVPMLRDAFTNADTSEEKLLYAKVLGILGDPTGVPLLIEALESTEGWDGKVFQGNMAEYAHLPTPLDAIILALGYSKDPRALPSLLKRVSMLAGQITLSHHRAVALALEALAMSDAARPLADLLTKPGMSGHAMLKIEPLYDRKRGRRRREGPLREIVIARVLYACGDADGTAKRILETYRHDIRGLFARHADAILSRNP